MKRMKKLFSKETLRLVGFTCAIVGTAFLIGCLMPPDEIDLGMMGIHVPAALPRYFNGITLSIIVLPFVMIGSIIHIVSKLKPKSKYVLIGYLILIVGIVGCIVGGITIYTNHERSAARQRMEERKHH